VEGAFAPTRPALFERGLLKRPDRRQRSHAAFLTRLRGEAHEAAVPSRQRGRIAFVTQELAPPHTTGGIGTYVAAAAKSLAAAGHEVTIALVCLEAPAADRAQWRDRWRRHGIELVLLPEGGDAPDLGHTVLGAHIARWLHGRAFDIVHFADNGGHGAAAVIARRQSLMLASTSIVVTTHGGTRWHHRGNGTPRAAHELRIEHAEARQLALADHVVSPSRFMLDLLDGQGRVLPASRRVLANVAGADSRRGARVHTPAETATPPAPAFDEVVFFGRLEPRKGIDLFCDAIDRLAGWRPELRVAFLGAAAAPEWRAYVVMRAQRWDRAYEVHDKLPTADALRLLAEGRRLAVMPSRDDNHPYSVLECLLGGHPFLAAAVGGIPEMVHSDDHARVLVPPTADALAQRIRQAVEHGHGPARPASSPEDTERAFIAWHAAVLASPRETVAAGLRPERPSLTIVLLDEPRGGDAVATAAALVEQRGIDFELHIGDNCLSAAQAETLWRHSPRVRHRMQRGCTAVRSMRVSSTPGWAARANAAVREGTAEYLLLCRAGIVADPRLAALLLEAVLAEGAAAAVADGRLCSPPPISGPHHSLCAPAAPLSLAPRENLFGGPCFLVRRTTFEALDGFRTDPALAGVEHWDLLNRVLLRGDTVARVPIELYDLPVVGDVPPFVSLSREALRAGSSPFLDRVPTFLRDAYDLLADGEWNEDYTHLAELQRLAASAPVATGIPLLIARGAGVAKALVAVQQADLRTTPAGAEVTATGSDPILVLPAIELPRGRQAIHVRLELECERSTLAQLFWICDDARDYSEARSVRCVTRRGPNVLRLVTPAIVPTGVLRLDPSIHPGRILIRSVVVESQPANGTCDFWLRKPGVMSRGVAWLRLLPRRLAALWRSS
jgi:O-antigen biosynthesis protein